MSEQSNALRGGEFLIRETSADAIFIPEEWTEEQLMMKQMTLDFVEQPEFACRDEADGFSAAARAASAADAVYIILGIIWHIVIYN